VHPHQFPKARWAAFIWILPSEGPGSKHTPLPATALVSRRAASSSWTSPGPSHHLSLPDRPGPASIKRSATSRKISIMIFSPQDYPHPFISMIRPLIRPQGAKLIKLVEKPIKLGYKCQEGMALNNLEMPSQYCISWQALPQQGVRVVIWL